MGWWEKERLEMEDTRIAPLLHYSFTPSTQIFLRPRMRLVVHFFQPFRRDVGVDLRGGKVGVPKQFLHTAQIGAGVEHVGGKGMTQRVRCDVCVEPGGGEVALQQLLHATRSEPLATVVEEDWQAAPGVAFQLL